MNEFRSNGAKWPERFSGVRFHGGDVTWAGPHPLRPGFCFGTEDGRLFFTDEDGNFLGEIKASEAEEAINGVAVSGDWMAVSTRAGVVMGSLRQEEPKPASVELVWGAHDIVATPSGYFAAPLGKAGVMMMRAGASPEDPVQALTTKPEDMDFYRVLALQGRDGKDLLVCACRQGGVGVTELAWGDPTYTMRVSTFHGLDVVDLCQVPSESRGVAVAGIGLDGTVVLFADILHDRTAASIRFKTLQGTPYRILSSGGDLYVLTSRALYVLSKLAARLLAGMQPGTFNTQILVVPMDAVDAAIVGHWLLVITPDDVVRLDTDLIGRHPPEEHDEGVEAEQGNPIAPEWRVYDISQASTEVVVAQ